MLGLRWTWCILALNLSMAFDIIGHYIPLEQLLEIENADVEVVLLRAIPVSVGR